MIDESRLEEVVGRYAELTERCSDPELYNDAKAFKEVSMERAGIEELAQKSKEYLESKAQLARNKADLRAESDDSMIELYKEEISTLEESIEKLHDEIRLLLLPKDPYADKNIIMEIRPAAGGDEAAIFAGDLFRMYNRYADSKGWTVSIMDAQPTGLNGYKEMVFEIQGTEVYRYMKYESGVHRVQRVPETESQGRVHTSTVTVAVLPEADEVDEIQVESKDLKVDTYRASGAGGQHVNKTDSAVRITHLPTGIVVTSSEKSQHQNRAKAMQVLRAKLYDMERQRADDARSADRKSQVGSGDRSERIRTYNFPQGRVTDHRINLTLYKLDAVIAGDLDEVVDALVADYQAGQLAMLGVEAH